MLGQDCTGHVKAAGFEEIDGWTSVYWHREGFEVKVSTEPVTKILSDNPELLPRGAEVPTPLMLKDPHRMVKGCSFNMTTLTEEIVRKYLDLAGVPNGRLHPAETPFLDEYRFVQGCAGWEVPITPTTKVKGEGKQPSLVKGTTISGGKPPAVSPTTSTGKPVA